MIPEQIGPYRIDERLGKGGMGEVYRAHDERLDRHVALKVIRAEKVESPEARRRFQREVRTAAGLNHPAIVHIHDVLEWQGGDCIVMELVEGKTLATLLEAGGIDLERALSLARQIADGLAAAHAKHIVHRDLKAENVMVTGGDGPERVKILDFGLAKSWLDSGESSLTQEGQVVGTYHAMSPEQAQGKPVDSRSDLFSLGALFYHLLSRQAPFRAPTAAETLFKICIHQPPPLSTVNPQVPAALSDLVERLLRKDPADRPRSAGEVSSALTAIADQVRGGASSFSSAPTVSSPGLRMGSTPTPTPVPASGSGAVLKTLLLSDLVGSTRLTETLGDERAAALFRLHDRAARDLLARYAGREIDKTDGFLMLFDRPLNAALYAQAYHDALEQLSEQQGVELAARVGIHIGEVVVYENPPEDVARGAKPIEVEGLAKPMTARLMSLALGRQTLITRGFYDVAKRSAVGAGPDAERLRWHEHGNYSFQGVEEPIRVFEVGIEGLSPLSPPTDSAKVMRVPDRGEGSASGETSATRIREVAGRRRRPFSPILAAGLALAAVAIGWVAPRDRPATTAPAQSLEPAVLAEVKARPAIAVLGFQNLSGRPEAGWIATASAEMLTTELGLGDQLRTIGGQEVARVMRELQLDDVTNLAETDLARLRRGLGVDLFVYGTYSLLAAESSSLLRLDVRLQDAASGQLLASEGATGTERQLFDILLRAGASLRRKLGIEELSPAQELAVQASLPTNNLAARLYSEGLAKLRRLDALGAQDLLEKAVQADPEHPLPHAELAAAWSALGYDSKAEDAAKQASELGSRLPANERRTIEARYFETTGDWEQAITTYASLFESFPDDVNLGLRLAAAQRSGGQTRQALVTLEALRRLPPPASEDPRIDLAEAVSQYALGELSKVQAAARRAAEKGEAMDSGLLVARARSQEARALQAMGDHRQAMPLLEEARDLFAEAGDRRGTAQALDLMALTVWGQGDLEGARKLFEQTLEVYRELGARFDVARVLTNQGITLLDAGRLAEADDLHREALDIFLELGAKYEAAATLTDLGFKLHIRGELRAASRKYEEALGLFSELGQASATAIAITNLAEVQYLLGNLARAEEMHEESLAINRRIGDKSGVAYDTFRLGKVSAAKGDLFVARSRYQEALEAQTQLGEAITAQEMAASWRISQWMPISPPKLWP